MTRGTLRALDTSFLVMTKLWPRIQVPNLSSERIWRLEWNSLIRAVGGGCKSLHRDNQFLHCRFRWIERGNSSRLICHSSQIFLYWIKFWNLCSFVTIWNVIWSNTIAGLDEEVNTLLALVLMVLDFLGAITRIYRDGTKAQQKTNI